MTLDFLQTNISVWSIGEGNVEAGFVAELQRDLSPRITGSTCLDFGRNLSLRGKVEEKGSQLQRKERLQCGDDPS